MESRDKFIHEMDNDIEEPMAKIARMHITLYSLDDLNMAFVNLTASLYPPSGLFF